MAGSTLAFVSVLALALTDAQAPGPPPVDAPLERMDFVIEFADGRLTHFIGVQGDVTERSQAAERLAYSEALYRSVAGAISDGLLVVDPEGHIVTLNPAACALIGRSAAELSGRALGELGFELRREDGRALEDDDHPVHEALREGRRVERTWVLPQLRAHADMIDPIAFEHFLRDTATGLDFDVMLEAKAKDLALLRLRAELAQRGLQTTPA